MPKEDFNDEKLIQITEPGKKVHGLTWDQFQQTLAQKGYPNPDQDNHLRTVFNLAGENHPDITEHARLLLDYDGEFNDETRQESEERVLEIVENDVLTPAVLGQDYTFDESQRETILYCQEMLNETETGRFVYDFNENHPAPEETAQVGDDWEEVERPAPEENGQVEEQVQVEEAGPNLDGNEEKVIDIIDPEKTVNGLNWEEFSQAMADKGYPDPEHDNHLRSVFNLAGEDHPEIEYHAEQLLGYDGPFDENFRQQSEERVLSLVEEEVLNPAREGQEYLFDESQRETILYCQRALNESGKGINEYQFEDYNPRPNEEWLEAELQRAKQIVAEQQQAEQQEVEQEEAGQNLNANEENVIGVIDPDKTVNGMNWEEFQQAMADKGYPDAEHDNHLRSVFNLAGQGHEEIDRQAEQLLAHEGEFSPEYLKQSEDRVLQVVEEDILNPARQGREFLFDESQRETILYCQDALNQSEKIQNKYDFEKDHPVPEEVQEDAVKMENEPEEVRENVAQPEEVQEDAAKLEDEPEEVQENAAKLEDEPEEVRQEVHAQEGPQREGPAREMQPQEGPRQQEPQQDDPNLLPINNPEKTIGGLKWEEFCNALKENGWPEPEKDNNIRAAFNLADANHQEVGEALEMYADGRLKVDQNNYDYQVEALRHAARDAYILAAKYDKNFTMDENNRDSVLHFQEQCNNLEREKFNFNAYHPVPNPVEAQAGNPEQVQEANQRPVQEANQQGPVLEQNPRPVQEQQLNQQGPVQEQNPHPEQQVNQQQNQQPVQEQNPQPAQPVDHDKELDHNRALYNEMHRDMQTAFNRLEDETVGVHFGSSEYSKAMNDVKKVSETWADLKGKNKDFQLSDHELEEARQKVYEAQRSIDVYLTKKARERKGKPLSTEKGASFYRQEAMLDARKTLQQQADILDEIAAQRGLEQPLPSDEKLARQRKSLANDLEDATRNVYNGSSEYKNAKNQFNKVNDLWDKTMANKAEGELPSAGEIENLKANIAQAKQAADLYLDKKVDLNNPKAKTEKRISAMSRARENLAVQERKLAEWEKKLAEQEPVKGYKELADNTTYLREQMAAADKGVIGGSKEFKEVNNLLKQQEEKWKALEKKGPDYKMTPDELREMVELNQKIEKNVDKYIADKAGKDLSEKTQKRLRAMQKVKNHTLSQRKKFEARRDEMLKEVEGISNEQIEKQNKDISLGMRNATRNVYFGSKAYKNAMVGYNRTLSQWRNYQAREAAGVATYAERNAQYKSLQENIKQIDKYLDSKKGKDLSKHPKTKKRVEIMQKAKENLQIRMRKLELAQEKNRRAEQEATRQQMQTRNTQLRFGVKSQRAMERNMAKASLAATKQLAELGNKKQLSSVDVKNARTALAALVIENIIRQPGNEQLKAQLSKGGKEYSKIVRAFANSKDFKKAFPDKMFTPNNVKNLATNPRSVERCTNHLFGQEVNRQQNMQQQRQLQQQRQNTKNTQMENTRNK